MSSNRNRKRWMKRYFNKVVRRTMNSEHGHAYRKLFGLLIKEGHYIAWHKRNRYQRGDDVDT